MKIVDNALILLLHFLCFYLGMKASDKYHQQMNLQAKEAEIHEQYALRLQQARMNANDYAAYVAPPVPLKRKKMTFGAPFEEKLKEQGRAVQLVNKDNPIA